MSQNSVAGVQQHEAVIRVSRTVLGQKTERAEYIEIRPFATTPAEVSMNYGGSMAMPDGNWVKVGVGIKMPCYVEEVREAFTQVKALGRELINTEIAELTAAGGKPHG